MFASLSIKVRELYVSDVLFSFHHRGNLWVNLIFMDYRDLEAWGDYIQVSNNIVGFSWNSENFAIEREFNVLIHSRRYAS